MRNSFVFQMSKRGLRSISLKLLRQMKILPSTFETYQELDFEWTALRQICSRVLAILRLSFVQTVFQVVDYRIPPVNNTHVFRGIELGDDLDNMLFSDDNRASFNPGFVVNDTEAPVWLVAEQIDVPTDASELVLTVESQAGTPGLSKQIELFNVATQQFEALPPQDESFNDDSTLSVVVDSNVSDYIDRKGTVQMRVGWRQTGFTINFPWEVRVDFLGIEAN